MKTLLTLGGETYLLPANTDPAKVLALFQNVFKTSDRNEWGPDGARYDDELHLNRRVTDRTPSRVRIELVADEEVVNEIEWNTLCTERAERERIWREKQPVEKKKTSALPAAA